MSYSDTRFRLIELLKQLAVAALYVLLAKIVFTLFSANGVISVIWPPSGLALAVLLIGGKRYYWSVFLGAFLANAITSISLTSSLAVAAGNTLEAFICVWLLTRNRRFDVELQSLRSYLLLILAAGIGCISGALSGATTWLLAGLPPPETYLINLAHWWMGDVLGIVLITPLALTCWQLRKGDFKAKLAVEAALLLGLTFVVGQVVFLGWFYTPGDSIGHVAKGYWVILCIVWAAARLETRGAVVAMNIAAIQALLGAYRGVGYFANDIAQTNLTDYWLFTLTLSVVSMALATFIAERRAAEDEVQESKRQLQATLDAVPDLLFEVGLYGRIYGYHSPRTDLLAAPPELLLGKTFSDILPPASAKTCNSALWDAHENGTSMGKQYELPLPHGRRWFELSVSRKPVDSGQEPRFIFLARDITVRKQAEEVLKLNKLIIDTAMNGFWIIDMAGNLQRVNEAYARLSGYSMDELLKMHISELDAEEKSRDEVAAHMEKIIAQGYDRFETRHRRKDGQEIDVEVAARFMPESQLFCSFLRDITERKRIENALRESEEMLKRAQSLAHIGHYKYDPSTGIVDGSDELFRIFGLTREQLHLSEFLGLIHPDDRAFDVATIESAFEQQTDYEGEHRLLLRDGTLKWIKVIGKFVPAQAEDQWLLLGTAQDITERKQAENALRESEERLHDIMNNSPAAIFIKDTKGQYLFINCMAEKIVHISNEAIRGRTDQDIFPPDLANALIEADRKVIHSGLPVEREEVIPQEDGRHIYLAAKFPLRDSSGNIYAVCGISTDITERNAAKQRLHDLTAHLLDVRENEKIRIAREIHDDLGATLNALKMDAYWLSRKLPVHGETALAQRIETMDQRVDDAIRFTRRIMDDLRPAILDDLGLPATIEWQAAAFTERTGIDCGVNCIEDEANLDKQRSIALFRILQEALTNISRHSGASRVDIEFLHNEDDVLLTVSDNGRGSPEGHMTTSKLHGSKSYGMLGMKERVEQLGGKITFTRPQGGGFTVSVTLPAGERSI